MRFSIWPSPAQSFDDIHEITAHCERTGWDGVYFADHFMPNSEGPEPLDGDILECWSVIAALAATVPRLRLAPLVTSVTYRHPAVLANIAAAVDQISHGRLTLGVGAGWQLNEHARIRHPAGQRARADGPVHRSGPSPALTAQPAAHNFRGRVLPAAGRAVPACTGPGQAAAAHRRRRRATDAARRGPVRG